MTNRGHLALPEVGSIEQTQDGEFLFAVGEQAISLELGMGVSSPNLYSRELARAALTEDSAAVIDLGCGSGAIGLLVARCSMSRPSVICSDFDRQAVELAKRNIERSGVGDRVRAVHADWLDGVPRPGPDELILASPPHTPCPPGVLERELARDARYARSAFGGVEGLDSIRVILAGAAGRGSSVMLSVGGFLLDGVRQIATGHGYDVQVLTRRLAQMSSLANELRPHIESVLGYRFARIGRMCVNEVMVARLTPAHADSTDSTKAIESSYVAARSGSVRDGKFG